MTISNGNVLISGASIAGPVLAYWLKRYGFNPTVVERAPALRRTGGHAVDLFGPSVDVVERMGILPRVEAARTSTARIVFERPGRRPVEADVGRLSAGISDRHVEIMRDELSEILHQRTRDDVEYVFGDSIRTMDSGADGVKVTFDHGAPRSFDLVVGADGLHSGVRRLTFGEESRFRHYLGGYLCVFTLPNYLDLDGRMLAYAAPGRMAATYPVRQSGQARAGFFFRRAEEFEYDHHDTRRQKQLLREVYAADGWEIPQLLSHLDDATDFYFDSISQIRMDTWSSGRVTLVGDAGYCPGPAVGGGTTLAAVGAYVLAGELSAAGGDHEAGIRRYEDETRDLIRRSRTIGPTTMKTIIPATNRQIWLTAQAMRLVPRLPAGLQQKLSSFQGGPVRMLEAITLKDYPPAR